MKVSKILLISIYGLYTPYTSNDLVSLSEEFANTKPYVHSAGRHLGSYQLIAIQDENFGKFVIASDEVIFSDYKYLNCYQTEKGIWIGGLQKDTLIGDDVYN